MRPHYSHSSRENATPSSSTSLLASYKGVPSPPPLAGEKVIHFTQFGLESGMVFDGATGVNGIIYRFNST